MKTIYKLFDNHSQIYDDIELNTWEEFKNYVEGKYIKNIYYTRMYKIREDSEYTIVDFGSHRYFGHEYVKTKED